MINYPNINSIESDNLILTSNSNKEFSISPQCASLSKLLNGAMEDFTGEIKIPLIDIDSQTLEIVVKYLEHCKGEQVTKIRKPINSSNMIENCDEWSANFIDNLDINQIGDIAVAANFMEIPPLVELSCCKIASMCYGRTDEQMMKEFGVDPNSFTEDEKIKIRNENADWLEDRPEKFFNIDN